MFVMKGCTVELMVRNYAIPSSALSLIHPRDLYTGREQAYMYVYTSIILVASRHLHVQAYVYR